MGWRPLRKSGERAHGRGRGGLGGALNKGDEGGYTGLKRSPTGGPVGRAGRGWHVAARDLMP